MDLIGATYERDVEPGEILIISASGVRSIKPFPPAPLAHCIFEHVYFARPDSYVFGRSVNESCVPISVGCWRASSRSTADVISCRSPTPAFARPSAMRRPPVFRWRMGLIRNHYVGRTFIQPQASIRHFGVKVKLNPVRSVLNGRRWSGDDSLVARHDVAEDRAHGARRGREGSPCADQLPADDFAVLLRRRHARKSN